MNGSKKNLVVDTSSWRDFESGGAIDRLILLPYSLVVPDVVFSAEVRHLRDADLIRQHITIRRFDPQVTSRVFGIKTIKHNGQDASNLSTCDCWCLAAAESLGAQLLTNDRLLCNIADGVGVKVVSALWVFTQLITEGEIDIECANTILDRMKEEGRRLDYRSIRRSIETL